MRDRRMTLALVAVLTAAMVPLYPHAASAALGARASVSPRTFQEGTNTVEFTFRISNDSSSNGERIGSVDIAAPGSEWRVAACPDAPSGWSARVDSDSRCLFESSNGASDDIGPGASSADFAVRVDTRSVDAGDAGTWDIHVQHTDSFNPGDENSSNRADGADASPDGSGALTVTAKAAPSPSPTSSPSPTKSPSPTPTKSPTPTNSPTPTKSPTPTTTPTATPTQSASPSPTPTPTRTNDPDPDPDPTPSASSTPSPTPAPSPTPQPPEQPPAPSLVPASDTGVSDRDELTRAETIVISGTAPGGDSVEVVVDGTLTATAPIAADGSYRVELPPLPDGTHEIVVVVVESGVPESPPSEPLVVTVDRTSPTVTVDQPSAGSVITDSTPTFAGRAGRVTGDLVPVTIDLYRVNGDDLVRRGEFVVFRTGDSWDFELPAGQALSPGTYTVLARQADAAGNVGASTPVRFTVTAPPQPTPTATPTTTPSTTPTPTPTTTPSPTPSSSATASPPPGPPPGGGGGVPAPSPAPAPTSRPTPPSQPPTQPRPPDECTTCGTPRDDSVTIGNDDLGSGPQKIETGDGADEVTIDFTDTGEPWAMTVESGEGNDTIVVDIAGTATSEGQLTIVSGAGNDMIMVNSSVSVEIIAGDGDDIIGCGSGSDSVSAGSGNDSVDCGGGNDGVIGGTGNDVVIGGGGNDTLSGGEGDDLLEGDAPANPNMSPVSFGLRSESLESVRPGNDTLAGGLGNDIVRAGGAKDTVQGGAGDDLLRGLAGADVMFGNDDDDIVSGGAGNDLVRGNGGGDVIHGGGGEDQAKGGTGDDLLFGDDGRDVLRSGSGDDALTGGNGRDRCVGDRNDSRRSCEKR